MCDLISSSLNSRGSWQCWTQNAILEQACWEKLVCSSTCCLCSALLCSAPPHCHRERRGYLQAERAQCKDPLCIWPKIRADQRQRGGAVKEVQWWRRRSAQQLWNTTEHPVGSSVFSQLEVCCSVAFRRSSRLKLESRERLVNACCYT